jgi:hypothetical protein
MAVAAAEEAAHAAAGAPAAELEDCALAYPLVQI